MKINDAGQKVEGGVPTTRLSPSEIVTYYGAIVGSNSEGDLVTWDGKSNTLELFNRQPHAYYDYSDYLSEDLEGRSLEEVMELVVELLG